MYIIFAILQYLCCYIVRRHNSEVITAEDMYTCLIIIGCNNNHIKYTPERATRPANSTQNKVATFGHCLWHLYLRRLDLCISVGTILSTVYKTYTVTSVTKLLHVSVHESL